MRRFKTAAELEQERKEALPYFQAALPTHKKLAIYARQSTKEQVVENTEAAEQQTTDLINRAIELGWRRADIILFVENYYTKEGQVSETARDASGRLRIDQRGGLQALTWLVGQGEIGAIMAWDVSRLFRDEDMIQPALFAKLCKEHQVLLLTYDDMFNFGDKRKGTEDKKRFLNAAQAAADYLTYHIKKMHLANEKKANRGEYAGRGIPVGFMLDEKRAKFIK